MGKIRDNADRIARWEERELEDAEVVVVAYGITSRVAERAIQMARAEGIKAGLLRPVVVWPFPDQRIRELALRVHAFVVVEMNYGQMVNEVERCAAGQAPTHAVRARRRYGARAGRNPAGDSRGGGMSTLDQSS